VKLNLAFSHRLPLGLDGLYTDMLASRLPICQGDRGAYIEVVTDKYAAPPLALKLHESVKTLYRT
jgi:hypothetical protein